MTGAPLLFFDFTVLYLSTETAADESGAGSGGWTCWEDFGGEALYFFMVFLNVTFCL